MHEKERQDEKIQLQEVNAETKPDADVKSDALAEPGEKSKKESLVERLSTIIEIGDEPVVSREERQRLVKVYRPLNLARIATTVFLFSLPFLLGLTDDDFFLLLIAATYSVPDPDIEEFLQVSNRHRALVVLFFESLIWYFLAFTTGKLLYPILSNLGIFVFFVGGFIVKHVWQYRRRRRKSIGGKDKL